MEKQQSAYAKTKNQRPCFCYTDSTIPLLSKSKISSLLTSFCDCTGPVCIGPGRKPKCWLSHAQAHMPYDEHALNSSNKAIKMLFIRKTCPYNVYPFQPHLYIVKMGFTGVSLFSLFLIQNIDCRYSLEPPRRGDSNVYPQSMF